MSVVDSTPKEASGLGSTGAAEGSGVRYTEYKPAASESAAGIRRRHLLEQTLRWTMPFVLLGIWQLAASAGWLDVRFFPGPAAIWSTFLDLIESGRLWEATTVTGKRVIYGFILGSGVGFGFGVILGISKLARSAFEPVIYGMWTIPKLALLPLLLLILGFGEGPLIALVVLNTMFLVLIPTVAAISTVAGSYREAARAFGLNGRQMFWHVLLPAALPEVFVSLRLAAGASVLVVVAGEFVTGNSGLGFLIWNSWTVFLPKPMYVGIVVVAVLGAMFGLVIAWLGRILSPWAEEF